MKERDTGGGAAPDGDCDMSRLTFLGRNGVARLVILREKTCMTLNKRQKSKMLSIDQQHNPLRFAISE
jgi:hypothetical protein